MSEITQMRQPQERKQPLTKRIKSQVIDMSTGHRHIQYVGRLLHNPTTHVPPNDRSSEKGVWGEISEGL